MKYENYSTDLLDQILDILVASSTYLGKDDIMFKVIKGREEKDDNKESEPVMKSDFTPFDLALKHLLDEGYIVSNLGNLSYSITFKGLLLVNNGNFTAKINREERQIQLQNFFWMYTPILALLNFIVIVVKIIIDLCN